MVEIIGIIIAVLWGGSGIAAYKCGFNRGEDDAYDSIAARKGNVGVESPKPICLCDHGINFHVNGRCKKIVNIRGVRGLWEVQCECRKYTGPEPIPELYHPLEIGR